MVLAYKRGMPLTSKSAAVVVLCASLLGGPAVAAAEPSVPQATCREEGMAIAVADKVSPEYDQCVNGMWMRRSCGAGTAAYQQNDHIRCGH